MKQTFTHLLTHLIYSSKVLLRPCGAYGVVVPPDPGLIALGYYPTPLRGLFRRWFPNSGLIA